MRRIQPSSPIEWRAITEDVPDYIQVDIEAIPDMPFEEVEEIFNQTGIMVGTSTEEVTEPQPDGLIERIVNDSRSFTIDFNTDAITTPNDGTHRVFNGSLNIGSALTHIARSGNTSTYQTLIQEPMYNYDTMMVAEQSVEEELTIDDSELAEPEPVVKRKVTRRKKEKPMFYKEETVGETTTLPILIGTTCGNLNDFKGTNLRCVPTPSSPFVKMIPMKVLTNSFDISHSQCAISSSSYRAMHYDRYMNSASDSTRAVAIVDLNIGLSQIVNSEIMRGTLNSVNCSSFETILKRRSNYFIKDSNLVDVNFSYNHASSFHQTRKAFINGETIRISARTFSASLGQLTCFLETEIHSRVYTPQVMGIVLPENYIYQKQYVLVHGKIDLSKVIVLVNRELDSTDFHNKNFRAYYRKHLLPMLNELKVDVWKVPVSFIEENCFHGGISLEAVSFMDKKKEIESIYDNFRRGYDYIDLDPQPEPESGDNYEEEDNNY